MPNVPAEQQKLNKRKRIENLQTKTQSLDIANQPVALPLWRPLVLKGKLLSTQGFLLDCCGILTVCKTQEEANIRQEMICAAQPAAQHWRLASEDIVELKIRGSIYKIDADRLSEVQGIHWLLQDNRPFFRLDGKKHFLWERVLRCDRHSPPRATPKPQNNDSFDYRVQNLMTVAAEPAVVVECPLTSTSNTAGTLVVNGYLRLPAETFAQLAAESGFPVNLMNQIRDVDLAKCRPMTVLEQKIEFSALQISNLSLGQRSGTVQYKLLNLFFRAAILGTSHRGEPTVLEQWQDEKAQGNLWLRLARKKPVDKDVTNETLVNCCYSRAYNFPPRVAKAIYDQFVPTGGSALDISAGFGGRLLGFWASKTATRYLGFDPNTRLTAPYTALLNFLETHFSLGKRAQVLCKPAEEMDAADVAGFAPFDVVFSSPPYFNCERYSNEPTQSIVRFPVYRSWLEGFLFTALRKAHGFLKDHGFVILNLKSVGNFELVHDATLFCCNELNLHPMKDIPLLQSTLSTDREPERIYVFQKK